MDSKVLGFLTKDTAGLPNWAWVAVVVAGAGVGYLFIRHSQATATATAAGSSANATGAADTSTAGMNAISQPSITDTSTNGTGIDYSSSLLPVSATNAASPVYVVASSPTPTPTSTTPTPTSTTTTTTPNSPSHVTVRAKNPTGEYDKLHPGGVPIHSGTSGQSSTLRLAPYGSQVSVTGGAVTGGGNAGNGTGNIYWYPVQGGGYISANDVVGVGGGWVRSSKKALALPGN